MTSVKDKMIKRAVQEYGKIFPCGELEKLNECFTQTKEAMLFWFNTEDNSTHLLKESIITSPEESFA